jgi:uncharacterized Zn finger protein (UPF0148 family)
MTELHARTMVGHRTLDLEHTHIMNKLKTRRTHALDVRRDLDGLQARVRELERMSRATMTDMHFDELKTKSHRAETLERELQHAQSRGDEVEYYMRTAPILFKYYDIIEKGGNNSVGGGGGGGGGGPRAPSLSPASTLSMSMSMSMSMSSSMDIPANIPPKSILHYFRRPSTSSAASPSASPSPEATAMQPSITPTMGVGAVDSRDRATLLEHYMVAVDASMPSRYVTTSIATGSRASVGPGGDGDALSSFAAGGGVKSVKSASGGKRTLNDPTGIKEPPSAPSTVSRGAAFLASSGAAASTALDFGGGGGSGTSIAAATEVCKHCGNVGARTLMLQDGYVFCPKCNTVEYVLVDHDKPAYKDPPKEIAYFAYKRINHFNEWLAQVQGKETTDIPDEVYDSILLEIKKQKITNMAVLTRKRVKSILKKLRINSYYEHIPHIINRLNGIPTPHIPPDLEDRLRHMFCTIQLPFLKHAPAARKNFLSYSFCLHKMMQLLEHDEYLQYFQLLKAREKLSAQDSIWKKICAEVGWDFIPSL